MTSCLRIFAPLAVVALLAGCATASPAPGSETSAPSANEVDADAEVEVEVETPEVGGTLVSIADGVVLTPEGFDNQLLEMSMPFGHTVDDKTFTVTVWGSSSCPSVPTLMATLSFDTVSMFFEDEPGDIPCTADLTTTTYEFTVPENIDDTLAKITIRHADVDEAIELTRDGAWLLPHN